MVFSFCNQFSTQHAENIKLSDGNENAQWVEKSSNLFDCPAERNRLFNFTYTGSGHFRIGLYALEDGKKDFKLKSRIECRKEQRGNGTIVITSFGRISVINGMHEIGFAQLDDFEDTFIFFDIKFGDIKIKPGDYTLRPLGSECVVNDHNEAELKDQHPEILCSREKPFQPNDSIAFIVKKVGSVSYWYLELLVTSLNNPEQKKSICYLDSKQGQFDFKMDNNYTVSHNGSPIFKAKDEMPLKLWFKIFRAEVTMQTLGENNASGHYNRYDRDDVNPDHSHTASSIVCQPSSDQTTVKQIFKN